MENKSAIGEIDMMNLKIENTTLIGSGESPQGCQSIVKHNANLPDATNKMLVVMEKTDQLLVRRLLEMAARYSGCLKIWCG